MRTVYAEISSRTALKRHYTKMHNITTVTLTPNFFLVYLLLCAAFLSPNMHILQYLFKFKIFIIKIQKDSLFLFLVLNAALITAYHAKAVQDDISAETVLI